MKVKCIKHNPYSKYSYNTGIIDGDGKHVYGYDNDYIMWNIRHGYGIPKLPYKSI